MSSTLAVSESFLWNLSEKGALSSVKELFDSVVIFTYQRSSLRACDLNYDPAASLVDDHATLYSVEWFGLPSTMFLVEGIRVSANDIGFKSNSLRCLS